jgi:hypothetical protein
MHLSLRKQLKFGGIQSQTFQQTDLRPSSHGLNFSELFSPAFRSAEVLVSVRNDFHRFLEMTN